MGIGNGERGTGKFKRRVRQSNSLIMKTSRIIPDAPSRFMCRVGIAHLTKLINIKAVMIQPAKDQV